MLFCGGTSLSQAHCVIERMSEDADFRIVTPEDMSNSARRKLLSRVKHEMAAVLDDAGFPLAKPMTAKNDLHIQRMTTTAHRCQRHTQ